MMMRFCNSASGQLWVKRVVAEAPVGDNDLYIIGAVCLSQKSLFLYSRDLVISPVSRHIPYSKELVVSMFPDTFVIKGMKVGRLEGWKIVRLEGTSNEGVSYFP